MVEIKDMVEDNKSRGATIDMMLKEFQSLNKIAVLGEEDLVIRGLLRGHSRTKIIEDINKKHKDVNITMYDMNEFIEINKDVLTHIKGETEKKYLRRLVQSKIGLTDNLTELAIKATQLADKYDNEGDHTNAIGAIRAAADVFTKVAKMEGHLVEKPDVNINMMMDKIVSSTSSESEFKKSILKIIDVENNDGKSDK